MAVFACVAVVFEGPPLSVPSTPPHAASSVPALDSVRPAAPRRLTSWRRDTRPSTSCSKKRSRSRSGSGMRCLLGGYENRVGWVPCEGHLATWADRLGLRPEAVLADGRELLAAEGVDYVLDGGAEEARDLDAAAQRVGAVRRVDAGRDQRQLLGAHAYAHGAAVQRRVD